MVNSHGYKYLASPYSSPSGEVRTARYFLALDALGWLLARRIWAYSPVAHLRELAFRANLPKDAYFWHEFNRVMVKRSSGLIVLKAEGWERSLGVQDEIDFALNGCSHTVEYLVRGQSPSEFFFEKPLE